MDPFFLPMLMRRPDFTRYSFDVGVPRPPYTNNRFRPPVVKPTNPNLMQSTKTYLCDYQTTQGEYWALIGHLAYEENDFAQAITHYNKAIEMTDGSVSTMFRARGLAFRKSGNLEPMQSKQSNWTTPISRPNYYVDSCWQKKANPLTIFQTQKEDLTNEQKDEELKKFIDAIGDPNEEYKFEIPSYLLCKLSKELMQEPVATEAGEVYEKQLIVNHFKASINQMPPQPIRDPTTKQEIRAIVHTVHNIIQATQEFLLQNPWAFEYQAGENYKDIEF